MKDKAEKIVYFCHCGEVNTGKLLRLVQTRCKELGIGKVVVASETGRSALQALHLFRDTGVAPVVVTHVPATTGPSGRIPIGLNRDEYAANRHALLEGGATIV